MSNGFLAFISFLNYINSGEISHLNNFLIVKSDTNFI